MDFYSGHHILQEKAFLKLLLVTMSNEVLVPAYISTLTTLTPKLRDMTKERTE